MKNGKHDPLILAYLAGIIDGEGCLRIAKNMAACYPLVTVRMVDREPCDMIASIMDANCLPNANGKYRKANHKMQFGVWLTGKKAQEFLRLVRPYLRIKAPQADALLDFPWLVKRKMTKQVLDKRMRLRDMVSKMNQREIDHGEW